MPSRFISWQVGCVCPWTHCSSLSLCFTFRTSCADPLIAPNILIKCQLPPVQFWSMSAPVTLSSLCWRALLENLLKSAFLLPFLVCRITCVHGEALCAEMGSSLFVKVKIFKYSVNYHYKVKIPRLPQ